MKEKIIYRIILFAIILLGFFMRTTGSNWDQGFHLHPDERMIQMTALSLHAPQNIADFLTVRSGINPHFFAYGSFPIYFLRISSLAFGKINSSFATYENIFYVGRMISIFSELMTIIVVFLIGRKIINMSVGIFASFFYAVSVLPIQTSHYYTVDTLLTLLILLTLFYLIKNADNPTYKSSVFAGIFLGLGLATKISAGTLIIPIFALLFLTRVYKKIALLLTVGCITFFIFQPYALIDFTEFMKQNMLQYEMTHNPFISTYTLQYVAKVPFLFELKNIFLWGLGPFISLLFVEGLILFLHGMFKKNVVKKKYPNVILLIFVTTYFLFIGGLTVGFMRYLLPIYPLLCIFAGVAFVTLCKSLEKINKYLYFLIIFILLICSSIWALTFLSIYDLSNTRVIASTWINKNIPPNKTFAVEHWDDTLPLFGQEKYRLETLELFNKDSKEKWIIINEQLKKSDYIIIASNRLRGPLQKLTDCSRLEKNRCYPLTAKYYKNLFAENLGFEKIVEFENLPRIPATKFYIDDSSADESFTVHDHPKITIFKKSSL